MRIENDLIHEAAVRNLSIDEYRELLIILSNTSKECLKDSISPTDLIKILSFMDFEDEETTDLAERISKLIFPLFPIDFVQESSDMLLSIFSVENYHLTLLIFNELTNVVRSSKKQGDVIIFTDQVLKRIVDIIFYQYLELSWTAQGLLMGYCDQSPDNISDVFQRIMKPKFNEISSNSVNVFRYIDVAIEIVLKSKQSLMFRFVIDDNVIAMINEIITNDDLLAHMNVLEVIKKVTSDPVGFNFVIEKNILDSLYTRLPTIVTCPFSGILVPGYLSLFGELCREYPGVIIGQFDDFLRILMQQFESDDMVLRLQTLEIFANSVSAPDCKVFIANKYENVAKTALLSLIELFTSSDPEQQTRSANALAHVLSAPMEHHRFLELSTINCKWHTMVDRGDRLTRFIVHLVTLPIETMKVAGYNLAIALSRQRWAQSLLCGKTDLIDHLMIRSDQWKSCIDLKFELIENLVDGIRLSVGESICPQSVADQLTQYYSEGKYFAPFHHEMMVDTDV